MDNFQPGEIIIWCDEEYEVVENYGKSGVVKQGDLIISRFDWTLYGETAVRKGYDQTTI